jgi:hypothetical protein
LIVAAARKINRQDETELARRQGVHETQVSRDQRNEYIGITLERAAKILDARISRTARRNRIVLTAFFPQYPTSLGASPFSFLKRPPKSFGCRRITRTLPDDETPLFHGFSWVFLGFLGVLREYRNVGIPRSDNTRSISIKKVVGGTPCGRIDTHSTNHRRPIDARPGARVRFDASLLSANEQADTKTAAGAAFDLCVTHTLALPMVPVSLSRIVAA